MRVFYFYFFFFKQKTAYEMRISDWSSDVCSSDLGFGLGRGLYDAEPVAQPLHGGAGDEDAAFQRVGGLAAEAIGNGRQQAMLRVHQLAAGVEEGKAAGAVGRLHHAGLEAGLADGGRLLIAGDAADGQSAAEQRGLGAAEVGIARSEEHTS